MGVARIARERQARAAFLKRNHPKYTQADLVPVTNKPGGRFFENQCYEAKAAQWASRQARRGCLVCAMPLFFLFMALTPYLGVSGVEH